MQLGVQLQPEEVTFPHWPKQEVGSFTGTSTTHVPELQLWPAGQVPQEPPQPSGPQVAMRQARGTGEQAETQVPKSQMGFDGSLQVPQEPPQPSSPQRFVEQSGVQAAQVPSAWHFVLLPAQPTTIRLGSAQSGSAAPQLQSH
jgi:hypothetical protein